MYKIDNRIFAYAKINLYLKIVGKDENFHMLEMLNTAVDFYDEIEIEKSNENLVLSNVEISNNNLYGVLEYFEKEYNIPKTKVKLIKNIFIGAGLAGGSTDAANLIKLLNEYYDLKINKRTLKEICLKFGSDTLYCFESVLAKVYGRGEKIKKVLPVRYYVLLVNPNIILLTKDVFKMVEIDQNSSKLDEFYEAYFDKNLALQNDIWVNDLEKAALKLSNELFEASILLRSIDKNFHLTGSGSTFFLISDDYEYLKEVKEKIPSSFKTVLTKTI